MADRTVTVGLRANVDQYKRAMHDAGVSTKGVSKSVDELGSRGSSALNSLSGGLLDVTGKTAAVAGGVAIAAGALLKFANDGIDAYTRLADQVDTYQDVTGASAEESSRMVAVANTLGVSTDSLAGGMFRLSRNVRENADGLKRFGIEAARNKDGSIDLNETLLRVSDAYNRVGGGAQGNAIAMAAFGRGGNALIDILERSRTELEGFWAEAERNHQILSDDDLDTARKYEIAMRELEMAWQGLAIAGAEVLLPSLIDVADALSTIIQKVADVKDSWVGDIIGVIAQGTPLGGAVSALGSLTGGSEEGADASKHLAEGLDEVNDSAAEAAANGLAAYGDAIDAVLNKTFGVDDANEQLANDLASLSERIDEAKEAGDAWATSLDASNTTGIANRSTLRDIAEGAAAVAQAMIAAGEDPTAAMQTLYAQLLNTLEGLGFNRTEAAELLNVLLQFPSAIGVDIDIDISKAEAALARLMRQIAEAPLGVDALEAEKWVARHGQATTVTTGGSLLPTITPSFGSRGSGSTKDPADEALKARLAEDARMGRLAEFGGITVDEYKAYLNQRIAATEAYTEEWAGLMGEVDRVNQEIGQSWSDAAEYMQLLEDSWWEMLSRQFEVGDISTADYLKQLRERLAGLQKFSDEWMETWRLIQQISDDGNLDVIEAVEAQRLRDEQFYGLMEQRMLSNLRAAAADPIVVRGGDTKSYSFAATVNGSGNTYGDLQTANQRMRDDAFLMGV